MANINIDQCGDDSETDSLESYSFSQTQQEPEIQTDPFQFAESDEEEIENKKVLTLIPKNATWKIIEEACKKLGIEFAQIRKKNKKRAIAEVNKKIKKNGEEAEESDMDGNSDVDEEEAGEQDGNNDDMDVNSDVDAEEAGEQEGDK